MINCIIIDDSKAIISAFTDMLELMGLEIVGKGYDGLDAVTLYKEHKPDLVFTDVNMPKYDGFYAVEEIKKFDPNAKIIVVTADFSSDTQERMNKLGVTGIISKPFDQSEIKKVLFEECKNKPLNSKESKK